MKNFAIAVCLGLILYINCAKTDGSYEITLRNRTDDCIAELHIGGISIIANANQTSSHILLGCGDYEYSLIAYTTMHDTVISVHDIIAVHGDRTCAVNKADGNYSYFWEELGE